MAEQFWENFPTTSSIIPISPISCLLPPPKDFIQQALVIYLNGKYCDFCLPALFLKIIEFIDRELMSMKA
ncbi:hypothetical protein [Okeania sp. KiyG1]|uniref:hypothetical protein n=1 Tax=Okeania sp. KiyG1 TaxID=2720165 RepID=UPI001920EE7D|nr:hypothetical protein [Okeania sp. KiyG1]